MFYAVAIGIKQGIYLSWDEAKKNVMGYPNAKYKKFNTQEEACNYINLYNPKPIIQNNDLNDKIIVFTDGSCKKNGLNSNKCGYAIIFPQYFKYNFKNKLNLGPYTNNRAEFMAFIDACQIANQIDPDKRKTLKVYTDSMLLINSITLWIDGWFKNDWKKSTGSLLANIDLLKIIYFYKNDRKIEFEHVKAHTNERDIAKTVIELGQNILNFDYMLNNQIEWKSIYNYLVDKLAQEIADI